MPARVPLDQWEAAAARQQAQYREAPTIEPAQPDYRTHTVTPEGLILQRTELSDLTH